MHKTKTYLFQRIILMGLFTFGLLSCQSKKTTEPINGTPTVIFLVRHAEKLDSSKDPELSEAGMQRAQDLATLLRSAKIEHIFSSDYKRTRHTAAPTAKLFHVKTELYDPRHLETIAKKLKETGGRSLVVGHSNSTPELVKVLGGDPGIPINEAGEYDRLYVLTMSKDGQVSTVLLRYGIPFETSSKEKN